MRFPLKDWIDAHADCRYDLASSGMRGAIPPPRWPRRRVPETVIEELRTALADDLGADAARVFVAHGASEANGWVLGFLRRPARGRAPVARVRYPEYPPLFDTARWLGYRVRSDDAAADVAIVSRPRNPEGDLWPAARTDAWAEGARHVLVDETFREFVGVPSLARAGRRGVWTTGSFTKFYGADEARVGFAVAPPEAATAFAGYVGVISDEVAPACAAVALDLLRRRPEIHRAVRRVVDRNLAAWRAIVPGAPGPVAPLTFDRPAGQRGRPFAQRCLRAGILVCPGELFGEPRGVRVCLTRRGAPAALRAYAAVRSPSDHARSARGAGVEALDGTPRDASQ